jgi:SAM-dependent methyltransferase
VTEAVHLEVILSGPCELDFAWYGAIRAELLRAWVGSARRVLDVGCGRGEALLTLAQQIGRGVGIDIDAGELAQAEPARIEQKITNVRFRQANALALPFPARTFDVVLLLGDVLAYPSVYGRHARVVAELRRVLKQGGIVVHESMNWEWEYRSYPLTGASLTRSTGPCFHFHRTERTPSGLETVRDYEVVPGTPFHRWILEQDWPMSPQGLNTSLEVKEVAPIPENWLQFRGVSRYKHYCPDELKRLYVGARFGRVEAFAYGATYDIVVKAGLLERVRPLQSQLAAAEAELASALRLGSGPWLYLVARK